MHWDSILDNVSQEENLGLGSTSGAHDDGGILAEIVFPVGNGISNPQQRSETAATGVMKTGEKTR